MSGILHLVFAALLALEQPASAPASAPAWQSSGDLPILVNHAGFTPAAAKHCLLAGQAGGQFTVSEHPRGRVVFAGQWLPAGVDLGEFQVGDFSPLRDPGEYIVGSGEKHSAPFVIAPDVYDEPINKAIRYYAAQRCGPNTTGYFRPCHIDDGRRGDNGQHRDVSGGWHDACDVRKWGNATIYGLVGLLRLAELTGDDFGRNRLLEEIRWGNRYFRALQEPDGWCMNHCGGDYAGHGDLNRWTDTLVDTADDRTIAVGPGEPRHQFCFVLTQAMIARLTRESDPEYAAECLAAGLRCLEWCRKNNVGASSSELGCLAAACLEMHRTTGQAEHLELAAQAARRMIALQAGEEPGLPISGFFFHDKPEGGPARDIWHGNWPLLSLCLLIEHAGEHPDRLAWRQALERHCRGYLLPMSERSAFGIVPFGLYSEEQDPGGARRIGRYWYRYFMEVSPVWYVGINAHLASNGVGLTRAARILGEPRLAACAQRQLDWILGVNPFDASTVMGVGHNQPAQYMTREFTPPTPMIWGAVVNGIAGSKSDTPDLRPGSWQTCEYWTPMICYTSWLMAEIRAAG